MKFVDEATIKVSAGNGGDGCLSFFRGPNIPKGGPDGGDGGDGGCVYLLADDALNTLVDFRYQPNYRAQNGRPGGGKNMTGPGGDDLIIRVPTGTLVYDEELNEVIGDMVNVGDRLLVAQGGFHGLGNTRFKSSTNRSPRRTTQGTAGAVHSLRLQLKLIADVGLLGLPNAGKSSLIRSLSAAKPKVADYPFTTLVPNLGVVRVEQGRSFLMADVPGLIAGAASGAGLGTRFLKHVSRTRLLFHVVDMAPFDGSEPADAVRTIQRELSEYSPTLAQREVFLVLNKMDLLPAEERENRVRELCEEVAFSGQCFAISAISGDGTAALAQAAVRWLETQNQIDEAQAEEEQARALQIESEVLERSRHERARAKALRDGVELEADDDQDEDDGDTEVVYQS